MGESESRRIASASISSRVLPPGGIRITVAALGVDTWLYTPAPLKEQMLPLNRLVASDDYGALDDILELAHVAGPGMARRAPPSASAESMAGTPSLSRASSRRKWRASSSTSPKRVTQRREVETNHAQPVKQILAKGSVVHGVGERDVCPCDDSRGIGSSTSLRHAGTYAARSTRNNLGCSLSGNSPISSRKIVPRPATSSSPRLIVRASVNAPRSWPNNSLSRRVLRDRRAVYRNEGVVGVEEHE